MSGVWVVVDAAESAVLTFHESWLISGDSAHPVVVGFLSGFWRAMPTDFAVVARDLSAIGLELLGYCARFGSSPGPCEMLVSLAVKVGSLDEAAELPGFVPLGDRSGLLNPLPGVVNMVRGAA